MSHKKTLVISLLAIAVIVAGYILHNRISKVRAAKLEHIAAPAGLFPPQSIWTQDISQAPLDPQSSEIISFLAGAGGWGNGRMQVDLSLRVLQANASTPFVPFQKAHGAFMPQTPTTVSTFPLPTNGGIEGQPGYQCDISEQDCHLIVVDRDHGKLYEAYQANYEENVLSAVFVAVWDLNRVYPPSGRGDQCTSGDAAGFPIAPLLFNADETSFWKHQPRHSLHSSRTR
jgi:hypothetical protein